MFRIEIVGAYDQVDIGPGEAFIKSLIGSVKPDQSDEPKPLIISVSKERLLKMLAEALEMPEAQISIGFDDIEIEVK